MPCSSWAAMAIPANIRWSGVCAMPGSGAARAARSTFRRSTLRRQWSAAASISGAARERHGACAARGPLQSHRFGFGGRHGDFHAIAADARRVCRKRARRRSAQYAPVAHVEGGAVQWADQARAAQAAFVEPRIGMCADIVEREDALLGAAQNDFTAAERTDPHGSLAKFRER